MAAHPENPAASVNDPAAGTDRIREPVSDFTFLRDADWWRGVLTDAFGRGFFGFLAFAIVVGGVCYFVFDLATVYAVLDEDIALLINMMPRVILALSVAALLWVVLPRERMAGLVGSESGLRGLVIAAIAGTITPGGPSSAYALLAVLAAAKADRGALVAYITAWALLGFQRILIWDVPFMGAEFSLMRFAVSMPLPIIAGLVARHIPITFDRSHLPRRSR
jgi:uncharacterized membrane protein YraQ (UPF0718 family)